MPDPGAVGHLDHSVGAGAPVPPLAQLTRAVEVSKEEAAVTPRVKFGLIAGTVGLLLNVLVSAAFGFCGPLVALVAGGAAGLLASQQEKSPTNADGARMGAVAGAIAGALVLIGQLIGGLGVLTLFQTGNVSTVFGPPPGSGSDPSLTAIYYLSGLGVAACFGMVGIALAALGGAGGAYLGTRTEPAPMA
jgi:hypothetical protein